MTNEQISAFLDEPHVCVIAVEQTGDRPPLAVPIWYGIDEIGQLYIWTARESLKARRIRACGRMTAIVQREAEPYAYISIEGTIAEQPAHKSAVSSLVSRYVPAHLVEDYLQQNYSPDGVIITVTPTVTRAVDFSE